MNELPPDLPNFFVNDLESAYALTKGKDPAANGISVLVGWGLRDLSPYVWLLDSTRFPRMLMSEDHAAKVWANYDGIVTWNGVAFDDVVIKKRLPDVRKTYARKRHVDLHAVCCLLAAGVTPARLVQPLEPGWPSMVPTLRADLVSTGWSLEAVARGTLKIGKLAGPQGADAVVAWNQGRYSEVTSYCIQDVGITRALFIFAWIYGFLISEERGRVNIPREVLA